MDHLGISNTVHNTGSFRVAGVATPNVSSYSGFWAWYVKIPLRKLARKIFDISVLIMGVCLNVYLSLQKGLSFSIYEVKVCSALYNLLYQFSQFPVSVEHLKLRKQKMAKLLSMTSHRAPWMDRWTIHGTVHSATKLPVLYRVLHLLFKC